MTTETQFSTLSFQRMTVDTSGVNPEPPMNPTWSEFKRLTWQAGVVHDKTGLDVQVRECMVGGYDASVGFTLIENQTFRQLWAKLAGVAIGVRESARATNAEGGVR